MLPDISSSKKNNLPKARDESVQEEIEFQNQNEIQPLGNEYANMELNAEPRSILNIGNERQPLGNEATIRMLDEQSAKESLDISDEIVPNKSERFPGGKINKISNEIASSFDESEDDKEDEKSEDDKSEDSIDLNNSMYLNTSTNIVNEDWLDKVKEKKAKKKKIKAEKGNKKPNQKEIKAAFNIAENIIENQEKPEPIQYLQPSTYAMDEDLIAVRGKTRKIKKKKSEKPKEKKGTADQANQLIKGAADQKEQPKESQELTLNGIEDEYWKAPARERLEKTPELHDPQELSEEMKRLRDWDFQPQKLDKIKQPSLLRRLLSYSAASMGKLVRFALQFLSLGYFWRAKSKLRHAFKSDDSWQEEKDHQTIPGWNGEKFSPTANSDKEVMADFRRVPTVWSRLTAAKAAEKVVENGEEIEKPLDPVISVMVEQPKSGSSNAMASKEVGHTMIGIEYSRKSAISGRYERYNLRYGFYPQYGTENVSISLMSLKKDLTVPGLMKDDSDHTYDVSRRYPAKPEQINAILKASENYADRGYSIYGRNCATFVKEMIVDTAHLETGGSIFKKSEIRYSSLANFGMFGAEAFLQNTKAGAENTIMDLSEKEDETYQGYGNKMAAAKDWANFKKSMKAEEPGIIKDTFTPGEIGEQMRRMEGEGTGEIGSYRFDEPLKDANGDLNVGLKKIHNKITKYGDEVTQIFNSIFPQQQQNQLPFEMVTIAHTLAVMGNPLSTLNNQVQDYIDEKNKDKAENEKIKRNDIREAKTLSVDQLRQAREKMSENVAKINILLFNYLKNDKRMHTPLMNLLSLMTFGIRYIDDLYAESIRGGDRQDEVTNIRDKLRFTKISVKAGDKQTEFTPSRYESYIQIYKDPETAVAAYARYKELKDKKDKNKADPENNEGLTKAEAKEFEKLDKLDDLAQEFDLSHRYMAEKDEYNQQDIDYAFQLQDKETKGLDMNNQDTNEVVEKYSTAGGIYITIFMNKFFKDMKEMWLKEPGEGGISIEQAKDPANVSAWLDDYLSERVNRKKDEFEMIVKGIYRSLKANADAGQEIKDEDVLKKLKDVIQKTSIDPNFSSDPKESPEGRKENMGAMNLQFSIYKITKDETFQFTAMVKKMIANCRTEDMKIGK